MRIWAWALAAALWGISAEARAIGMEREERMWARCQQIERVELEDYRKAIDKKPRRRARTEDPAVIGQIMALLRSLPTDGDMFVSFAQDVPFTRMRMFGCGGVEEALWYGGKIKTPGTTFFARGGAVEETERALRALVEGLLK